MNLKRWLKTTTVLSPLIVGASIPAFADDSKSDWGFGLYAKTGTVSLEEGGIEEGNKAFMGAGGSLDYKGFKDKTLSLNGELTAVLEPGDDDPEMDVDEQRVGVGVKYDFMNIRGVDVTLEGDLDYWQTRRNPSPEPLKKDRFSRLSSIFAEGAVGLNYGRFNGKIGIICPIVSNGKFGYKASGRFNITDNLYVDVAHERLSFSEDGINQPELDITRSWLEVGVNIDL